MISPRLLLYVLTGALCWDRGLPAAIINGFDPVRHDRFLSDGQPNPSFLVDESQLSGVALGRGVLITPRHFITATHVGATDVTFRGTDGLQRTYQSSSSQSLITAVPGKGDVGSDIRVHTLSTDVDANIRPVSIIVGDLNALIGQIVIAFDAYGRAARNTIDAVPLVAFDSGGGDTVTIQFSYDTDANGGASGLGADEIGLLGGDSGFAALLEVDGHVGLIGTHMGIDVPAGSSAAAGDRYDSFSSLVGAYEEQLQAIVAADGYSLQTIKITAIPEPSFVAVLCLALSLGCCSRRRQGKSIGPLERS